MQELVMSQQQKLQEVTETLDAGSLKTTGFCVLIRDLRGSILYSSENAGKVLGVGRAVLVGKKASQLLPLDLVEEVMKGDKITQQTQSEYISTYELEINEQKKIYKHTRVPILNNQDQLSLQMDCIQEEQVKRDLPIEYELTHYYLSCLNALYDDMMPSLRRGEAGISTIFCALNYCLNRAYQNKLLDKASWQQLSRGIVADVLGGVNVCLFIEAMCRMRMFWYVNAAICYLRCQGHVFKRYVREQSKLKLEVALSEVKLIFISAKKIQFNQDFIAFGRQLGVDLTLTHDKQRCLVLFKESS